MREEEVLGIGYRVGVQRKSGNTGTAEGLQHPHEMETELCGGGGMGVWRVCGGEVRFGLTLGRTEPSHWVGLNRT